MNPEHPIDISSGSNCFLICSNINNACKGLSEVKSILTAVVLNPQEKEP